jgi:hypothetical protein
MPLLLDDLIGLNAVDVHDMPMVGSPDDARVLLSGLAVPGAGLVPAGMRHSQGGHTALERGRVLLTETLRQVTFNAPDQTVTAESGATWSQIHHTLLNHGRAPLVHQSSGHFTVGGSIAVNCHGRDPSQGPLANTVVSMDVLCGDGVVRTARAGGEHDDLFRAVAGGHGCCGLILRATFKTTTNPCLQEVWDTKNSAGDYLKVLKALPTHAAGPGLATLHYGWLCCLPGKDFLNEVVYANYVENPGGNYELALKDEAWGTSEVLRASWAVASRDVTFQAALWREIKQLRNDSTHTTMNHRMNWMRAAVSFTASRGNPDGPGPDRVEMLQEYFVPPENFEFLLASLRAVLRGKHAECLRLLTCTVRLVQPDACHTLLSYAPDKRVCLALELSVPLYKSSGQRAPTGEAVVAFRHLIDAVIAAKGGYYLPYYKFALPEQFKQVYGSGAVAMKQAIQKYDPARRFNNEFLTFYGL